MDITDLYGCNHCFVQFGAAPGPFQTMRAELRATVKGLDSDTIWRVKVPGYGWRKLRLPTMREKLAGNRSPYVILTGDERATISAGIAAAPQGDLQQQSMTRAIRAAQSAGDDIRAARLASFYD